VGLRVIGAGFGRTGTNSLQEALEKLGFAPCHHCFSETQSRKRWKHWAAAERGEKVAWDEVFEGFAAAVDWPSTYFWRELSDHYPDAKVILTVRPVDSWYESIRTTLIPWWHRVRNELNTLPELRSIFEINRRAFGDRLDDPDHVKAVYVAHNEEVTRTIPAERLLVVEVGKGWEPLCRFLDVPVPDEPYPTANKRDDFNSSANQLPDVNLLDMIIPK
jgi:hypothetical protein